MRLASLGEALFGLKDRGRRGVSRGRFLSLGLIIEELFLGSVDDLSMGSDTCTAGWGIEVVEEVGGFGFHLRPVYELGSTRVTVLRDLETVEVAVFLDPLVTLPDFGGEFVAFLLIIVKESKERKKRRK